MKKSILLFFIVMMLVSTSGVAFAVHTSLTAADAETDGVNGFTQLDGAYGVETFTVSGVLYAIVASDADDGVQIINLSDPTNITAVDAETDGVNGFTELNGATNVAIFTVSGVPYAIVASYDDDGVQIINLSDPTNITAADAESHGVNGFTALDGANDVATFTVSNVPYAIVTGYDVNGVQIINLSDPTNITAADAEFDGANGFTELGSANDVTTFTVDNIVYAIVASEVDDGVQIINLSDPTNITAADAETDGVNGFTELNGAAGVETFTVSGVPYAIVTSIDDDGVQIINLSDPTNITAADAETDGVNGFTVLDRAGGLATFTISDTIVYAIVASDPDNGVQIINLSDPTNIVAGDTAINGVNGFTELSTPFNIATFTFDNIFYAIVTNRTGDGVQIIKLPFHTISAVGGGGCGDCTAPTIGLDDAGRRLVDGGFSYNGVVVDAIDFHTPYPLITTETDKLNTVTVKVYENNGLAGIRLVQFGLGLEFIETPLSNAEVIIEVWYEYGGVDIEAIIITDKENLIRRSSIQVFTESVDCRADSDDQCSAITLKHIYDEAPIYNIMRVEVMDISRNVQSTSFNHGLEVIGESFNPPNIMNFKPATSANYPQRVGLVELIQFDRAEKLWLDPYGFTWQGDSSKMVLLTPVPFIMLDDDPESPFSGYSDRLHSHFAIYKQEQAEKAILVFDSSSIQGTLGDSFVTYYPDKVNRLDALAEKMKAAEMRIIQTFDIRYPGVDRGLPEITTAQ